MDEEQIKVPIVSGDLLDAGKYLVVGSFQRAGRTEDLACDEDIAARKTGLADRFADFLLVHVELGRVDVSVPGLEGS